MNDLKVALVGCGVMGMVLGRSFKNVKNARITTVCDIDTEALGKAQTELDAEKAVSDYQTVLSDPSIDAVIIATPSFLHPEMVIQAAEAKKQIYTEKPMAFTIKDCEKMTEAADSAGVKLMVGHVLRYISPFPRIKELVDSGKLGQVCSVEISRVGKFGHGKSWRWEKSLCQGILYEVHIHELDYMTYLLGDPVSVYAQGGNFVHHELDYPDDLQILVQFGKGRIGMLHGSGASAMEQYTGKVICEKGTVFFNLIDGTATVCMQDGKPEPVDLSGVPDPHVRELQEFVDSVLNNTKPTIDGLQGRRSVSIAQAADRSIETSLPVRVDSL